MMQRVMSSSEIQDAMAYLAGKLAALCVTFISLGYHSAILQQATLRGFLVLPFYAYRAGCMLLLLGYCTVGLSNHGPTTIILGARPGE